MQVTRGDTKVWKFQRHNIDGTVITELPDQIYFTIKKLPECTKVVQKTLDKGITYSEADNFYHIKLEPNDTAGLDFGTYGFDIEVNVLNYVKTICVGKLKIGIEYTTRKDK